MNIQNIDQVVIRQAELAKRLSAVSGQTITAARSQTHAIGQDFPEFNLWGPEWVEGKLRISILPGNSFADVDKLQDVELDLPEQVSSGW